MKFTLARTMNKSLRWLLAIGATSAIGIQGVYVYKFGFASSFTLSNDPAVWGQYGDYIGGLLNPIFSSLAFSGLIVTIILQARQIDESKHQSALEEMQRVQSTTAARIDQLLSSPVIVNTTGCARLAADFIDNARSTFELIAALGTFAVSEPSDTDPNWPKLLWDGEVREQLEKLLEVQTTALRLEFESLSWMLLQYQEHQGSEVVLQFYKYRYCVVLVWLDALGMLKSHSRVQAFFKPKDFRQYMT